MFCVPRLERVNKFGFYIVDCRVDLCCWFGNFLLNGYCVLEVLPFIFFFMWL